MRFLNRRCLCVHRSRRSGAALLLALFLASPVTQPDMLSLLNLNVTESSLHSDITYEDLRLPVTSKPMRRDTAPGFAVWIDQAPTRNWFIGRIEPSQTITDTAGLWNACPGSGIPLLC